MYQIRGLKKSSSSKQIIPLKPIHTKNSHKSPQSLDYALFGEHLPIKRMKKDNKSSGKQTYSQKKTQNKLSIRQNKFTLAVKTVRENQRIKRSLENDLKLGFKKTYPRLNEKKYSMPVLSTKAKQSRKGNESLSGCSQLNQALLNRMSCILDQYKLQLCRSQKEKIILQQQNSKLKQQIKIKKQSHLFD